ncbi:MAG: Protein translocase subunit SecE [Myxococcota bacterium]|nr:Protein translocase subunit SecE [Myxococcota bacterium]
MEAENKRYILAGYAVALVALYLLLWKGLHFLVEYNELFVDRGRFFGVSITQLVSVIIVAAVGYVVWRRPRVHELSNDVAVELRKVTWPSKDETTKTTMVVILFSIVAALGLFVFDRLALFTTNLIY